LFFIELQLVESLLSQLESHSFIKGLAEDESPDHFSLVFSSLRPLKEKNGKDSLLFKASLQIVDQLVSRVLSTFDSVYDKRVVTELVFLGNDNSAQLIPSIKNSLAPVLSKLSDLFLPQLYISPSTSETLLPEIEAALNHTELVAYFFPRKLSLRNSAHWRSERGYLELEQEVLRNNKSGNYTVDQVAEFQMLLWTPIVLAIVLIVVIYNLAYLNSGTKDSMLYRSVQTRHPHQS